MSKSTRTRAVSLLVGLLLCMVFMQTAFAAENATGYGTLKDASASDAILEGNSLTETPVNSQVEPNYDSEFIMAGNQVSITVSFTNKGNETVTLTPKLLPVLNSQSDISKSWIKISPANATVAPGSVQKFNIMESIPKDTESGYYQGQIVFTDDLVPNSTDYVNSMQLGTSVQSQPKIELQASYIFDNVENGKEYKYQVNIKNIASKDITIDPKLINNSPGFSQAFGNDAIKISAPSTLKAGEVANLTLQVQVPENATGSYNGNIDMNVNGKANDGYNSQLGLSFSIWQQPVVPYVKNFNATTNEPIMIEVSTDIYNMDMGLLCSPKKEKPSFELGLTRNSSPVNLTFMKSVESGTVGIGSYYPLSAVKNENIYQNNNEHYIETYTVPGAIGNWKLTILPKNTNNFGYSITIGDNNPAKIGDK